MQSSRRLTDAGFAFKAFKKIVPSIWTPCAFCDTGLLFPDGQSDSSIIEDLKLKGWVWVNEMPGCDTSHMLDIPKPWAICQACVSELKNDDLDLTELDISRIPD